MFRSSSHQVGIDHTLRNGSSHADIAYDPHGASLHNPMWATAMGQGAGALFWYSDTYVAPRNLWYHYSGFRKFVDGIPWASASLRPLDAAAVRVMPPDAKVVSVAALVAETPPEHNSVLAQQQQQRPMSMWLWVRNVAYDSSWMLAHQGRPVPPVPAGVSMTVPCGVGGAGQTMKLEWFSTTTGVPVSGTSAATLPCNSSGLLQITLPTIATDLAATLKPTSA